jgi:hypothetical protein
VNAPQKCNVLALILHAALTGAIQSAQAQSVKASYSTMAPLSEYMISDENSEIVLARSAAPRSISDGAEVMVLGREGYRTAARGTNGFMCWWSAHGAPQPTTRSSGIGNPLSDLF